MPNLQTDKQADWETNRQTNNTACFIDDTILILSEIFPNQKTFLNIIDSHQHLILELLIVHLFIARTCKTLKERI